MENDFISLKDLSKELGLSYKTLYYEVKRGNLHAIKIGKGYKVYRRDVDIYINNKRSKAYKQNPNTVENITQAVMKEQNLPKEFQDLMNMVLGGIYNDKPKN